MLLYMHSTKKGNDVRTYIYEKCEMGNFLASLLAQMHAQMEPSVYIYLHFFIVGSFSKNKKDHSLLSKSWRRHSTTYSKGFYKTTLV
jgi:hypothetical protein